MQRVILPVSVFVGVLCLAPVAGAADPGGPSELAPAGCYCVGRVGNVNCDYRDAVTIGDVSMLIDHLYISGCHLPNLEEANCDGDPNGDINLSDVLALIDHLFISERELPLCPAPPSHPPHTYIDNFDPIPVYISGPSPDVPSVGVTMHWHGSDQADFPYYPPPFEFEYRLYGPYTDAEYDKLIDSFRVRVFETVDGRVYHMYANPPVRLVACDTTYEGGTQEIACDTLLLDTVADDNSFGSIKYMIDVEDPAFESNPVFSHIALSSKGSGSQWISDTSVILYDFTSDRPSDTTRILKFIFWVRARNPVDDNLYDPVPATVTMRVIDPRRERAVMVLDWTNTADENGPAKLDTVAATWQRYITNWIAQSDLPGDVVYDPARDYGKVSSGFTDDKLRRVVFSHRALVLLQDAAVSGNWARQAGMRAIVYQSIENGASAWLAARVPAGSYLLGSQPAETPLDTVHQYCFGTSSYAFTGWLYYSMVLGMRIEDFCGARPVDSLDWPYLALDSALLHGRYRWSSGAVYPWRPDLAALPEVGALVPLPDAEVLYRYESMFGDTNDPVPDLSLNGLPVMVRLERDNFRTAQSLFTPLALDPDAARSMVFQVLDWLYEPHRKQGGDE